MTNPTSVDTATDANGWYPTHSPAPAPTSSPWAMAKDSLLRRTRGMHALWLQGLSSMTLEQVNYVERDGVLPIAFTVNHVVRMEDFALAAIGVRPQRWDAEGWGSRVGVAVDDLGKETTVEQMMHERIGNYDELIAFARSIFAETERWLDELPADALGDVLYGGEVPAPAEDAYVHRIIRDEHILCVDAFECWVYQHGIRHLGELEHARALVGLGGLTS